MMTNPLENGDVVSPRGRWKPDVLVVRKTILKHEVTWAKSKDDDPNQELPGNTERACSTQCLHRRDLHMTSPHDAIINTYAAVSQGRTIGPKREARSKCAELRDADDASIFLVEAAGDHAFFRLTRVIRVITKSHATANMSVKGSFHSSHVEATDGTVPRGTLEHSGHTFLTAASTNGLPWSSRYAPTPRFILFGLLSFL